MPLQDFRRGPSHGMTTIRQDAQGMVWALSDPGKAEVCDPGTAGIIYKDIRLGGRQRLRQTFQRCLTPLRFRRITSREWR